MFEAISFAINQAVFSFSLRRQLVPVIEREDFQILLTLFYFAWIPSAKLLTKIRELFPVHFQIDREVISSELLGEPSKHLLYRALTMFLWSFVLVAFDFRDNRSCHFPSSNFSKSHTFEDE